MTYKRYEKYKDSGVEWVNKVPISWNKSKVAWSFKCIGSGGTPKSSNEQYYNDGTINWLLTGDLNDGYIIETSKKVTDVAIKENSTLKEFKENSIVIAMYGATIGKLGITKIRTTTNQACCVMSEPIDTNIRFMYYWFLGNRKEIINLSQGGGQPNISQSIVKSLLFYKPSLGDQEKIADFLDRKNIEIDNLIQDKENLIELLKEQRQAIITESVTKGLDKNVSMKYSGVEWIETIPEHWNVSRLKHIADVEISNVDKKTVDGEKSVLLCNYTDVYYKNVINSEIEFMKATAKDEQITKFTLKYQDVMITKDSESPLDIGVPAWVGEDLNGVLCGYHMAHIRCRSNALGKYIYYSMLANGIRDQYYSTANGVTRFGLGKDSIRNSIFFIPNMKEQEEIINYLDKKTIEIDSLISDVKVGINNLKDYKQSLISEVVTGKINILGE